MVRRAHCLTWPPTLHCSHVSTLPNKGRECRNMGRVRVNWSEREGGKASPLADQLSTRQSFPASSVRVIMQSWPGGLKKVCGSGSHLSSLPLGASAPPARSSFRCVYISKFLSLEAKLRYQNLIFNKAQPASAYLKSNESSATRNLQASLVLKRSLITSTRP